MSKRGKCHPTVTGETHSWLRATPVDPDEESTGAHEPKVGTLPKLPHELKRVPSMAAPPGNVDVSSASMIDHGWGPELGNAAATLDALMRETKTLRSKPGLVLRFEEYA